jgi:Protein of unknown function (DUF1559)
MQCTNNLKQLELAVANYQLINGCLPRGTFPRDRIPIYSLGCTGRGDFSVFVRLPTGLEQSQGH